MLNGENAARATRCLRKVGLNRVPFVRATQESSDFLGGQEIDVAGPVPRLSCPQPLVRTVFTANRRPTSSTATTVCVRLCESVPIMTMPCELLRAEEYQTRRVEAGTPQSSTTAGSYQATPPRVLDTRRGRTSRTGPPPVVRQRRNERTSPGDDQDGIDAKKAEACRRIEFARRSSRTSRRSSPGHGPANGPSS